MTVKLIKQNKNRQRTCYRVIGVDKKRTMAVTLNKPHNLISKYDAYVFKDTVFVSLSLGFPEEVNIIMETTTAYC